MDAARNEDPGKRESQTTLAREMTQMVHGDQGLAIAERAKSILFGGGSIEGLDDGSLNQIFADVPSCELPRSDFQGEGYPLIDALVDAGLCASKGEARRTIKEGGANVNNERVTEVEIRLTEKHLASDSVMILRRGKRKYGLIRLV